MWGFFVCLFSSYRYLLNCFDLPFGGLFLVMRYVRGFAFASWVFRWLGGLGVGWFALVVMWFVVGGFC